MGVFYISGLNPLRWTLETFVPDPNLNSLPADYEIDPQSYAVPIQKTDINFPALILLSDFPDMTLQFLTCRNVPIISPPLVATETSITNQTFLQYLAIVDFSAFPTGQCYARVSYLDDDENPVSWISCPIDVQQNHADTQLMQYQNSENTESVLFHPANIILQTRIAANFTGGYQSKANRETFEDQPYNPVLLNGFNSDIRTQYLTGYEVQLPDWRIQQMNLIWSKCDQVKIDYDFYVAVGDIKGERPTATYNRNGYNYEIDLQIVKGFEFGQLTAGVTPTGDLIVVRKVWPVAPFPNFAASFAINGIFTQYSTLDYFQTVNPELVTFNLKLGTGAGLGDIYDGEIGTPNADASIELIETHDLGRGFNVPTTIYCTLPDGVTIKALFIYDQLDSPPVNNGGGSTGGGLPQGTIAYYKELVAGYFTRDWDIATGLGQIGSLYEGCQIYDEAAGKVLVAWDRATIDPDAGRGTPGVTGAIEIGNPGNEVQITREVLPAEGLNMFTAEVNNTVNDTPGTNDTVARAANDNHPIAYEMRKGTIPATIGVTDKLGAGASMYIGNDGLIVLCYIKL